MTNYLYLLGAMNWGGLGSILVAVLILLFMITIHEAGHYLVAKIFDFKINEFAIGMGPAIFKKEKKNGEIFSIRILPLGGFCAFEGEDDENKDPRAFNNKKPWQRILVLLAGATMNFLAAVFIFMLLFGSYGQSCLQSFEVIPTESAYSLESEDVLLSLNGRDIYITTDILTALKGKKTGDMVEAEVLRGCKAGDIIKASEGKREKIQIKLACDPDSENLQDFDATLKSLSIAQLFYISDTDNKFEKQFITGDYILRISKEKPEIFNDELLTDEKYTDCYVLDENGEFIRKAIYTDKYNECERTYTFEDFKNKVFNFNAGDMLYVYVSRYNEITAQSERLLLEYDLKDFTDSVKAQENGIADYFGIKSTAGGYRMYSQSVKFGFVESIARSIVYAFKTAGSTFTALGQLLTGKLGLNALGGPVTTISMTSQYVSMGFNYMLEIAGFIGVSLAAFNILPIPALDGARAVFVLIEWIRKKPIDRKIEGNIHAIGLVLLLVFAVTVDLIKCF